MRIKVYLFLIISSLFICGCGNSPLLSLIPSPVGSGSGSAYTLGPITVNSTLLTTKASSATLTAPAGSTIQISWVYSGVSDTEVKIIVTSTSVGIGSTKWTDTFSSTYTKVTYGVDPSGLKTDAGTLTPGTYTVLVYLGHSGGSTGNGGFVQTGLGIGTITIQ